MKKIAVLITCHNRVTLTLECLRHLYFAFENSQVEFIMDVYLTDDGSTDFTSEKVASYFPSVKLLKGDGKLFWTGGMLNSWKCALRKDYDGFLLLNDDTFVHINLFDELNITEEYTLNKFGQKGIYIGSTKDDRTNIFTYGGSKITSKLFFSYRSLPPNGHFQECELGNANIMYVSMAVVDRIYILSDKFKHGAADFDFTLRAVRKNLPVIVAREYLGICRNDKFEKNEVFLNLSLLKRIDFLYNPVGLGFRDYLNLMKGSFFLRVPFVFLMGWFKVLFPHLFMKLFELKKLKKS